MAQQATSRLYYDGLFRGHPAYPYHCAVDGVSHLLVVLIQLNRSIQLRKGMVGLKSIPICLNSMTRLSDSIAG